MEIDGKPNNLEFLVTTKKSNPLLDFDWMEKLGITLDTGRTGHQINHVTEHPDIIALKRKFQKTFPRNPYCKGTGRKNTTKRRCEIDTAKRKTDTNPSTTIGKTCLRFTETERNHHKEKGTNAKNGGINLQNLQKNCGRTGKRDLDFKVLPGLCVRPTTIIQRSPKLVHICRSRWKELYR